MLKNRIGTILIASGAFGIGISLIIIAGLIQQVYLLAIGSIVLMGDGVYLLKQYYCFLR